MPPENNKDSQTTGGAAGIGSTTGGAIPPKPDQQTPPPPPPKPKMVEVPESLIQQILKKQEEQDQFIKDQALTIEQLKYAADKGRMGIWEQRNAAGDLIRTANIGIWTIRNVEAGTAKKHIVLATKMVFQDVVIEENGGVRRLIEKQTLRLFLDDGPEKDLIELDVPYAYFYNNVERERATIIGESKSEKGIFRKMRFEDGREIDFDINFLNY